MDAALKPQNSMKTKLKNMNTSELNLRYYVTRHHASFGGVSSLPIDYSAAQFGTVESAFRYAHEQNKGGIICCVHDKETKLRNTWLTDDGWH